MSGALTRFRVLDDPEGFEGAAGTPPDGRAQRVGTVRARWIAAAGFGVLQLLMLGTGARLSTEVFDYSWQLLDVNVLRRDPLGSVWMLHVQPPLYNLVVGVVLRWSPIPPALTFLVLLIGCLLVVTLVLVDLARFFGLGPLASAFVALVVVANPETFSQQLTPAYELPVAAMVCVALWCVMRYLRSPETRWLVGCATAMTAAVMTRSLFHPLWLVGCLAGIVVVRPPRAGWRAVGAALIVPVAVIGGWMVKNEVLFGSPTLSSWLGMNLQRGITAPLPADDLAALVAEGRVSPVSTLRPFSDYESYAPLVHRCTTAHTHPAVSRSRKTNGDRIANLNYECYLPLYDQAGTDAGEVLRAYPAEYLRTRWWALGASFTRGTTLASPDHGVFAMLEPVYDVLTVSVWHRFSLSGWNMPVVPSDHIDAPIGWSLVAAAVWLTLAGVVGLVRLVRGRGHATDVIVVLASATVWFVVVGGDLIELGENGRFRTMIDPIMVGLALISLVRVVARAAGRPNRS